ncbi:hypothetical protein VTJ04DRAFT_5359 [Mycothermus thermophilus]|uniref:uncharacterized protein n=1 Tax=Humicola insolens TaxID=85995 RepID=UPI0037445134
MGDEGLGWRWCNRREQRKPEDQQKSTAFHSAQDPGAEIAPENIHRNIEIFSGIPVNMSSTGCNTTTEAVSPSRMSTAKFVLFFYIFIASACYSPSYQQAQQPVTKTQ